MKHIGRVPRLGSIGRLEEILEVNREELRSLAENISDFYRPFDQRKRNEKKWRHIDNPLPRLKLIQRRIGTRILESLPLPPSMLGGVRHKSIYDHATPHVGQRCLVTLDLQDCFPSITENMVFSVFLNDVDCSVQVARLLARLTTFNGVVPQGAPSSLALVNRCLLPMHRQLLRIAGRLGLNFTQWVDDLAFSGARASEVIQPAYGIAKSHGFRLAGKKTGVMRSDAAQAMAGLTVNQCLAVDSTMRRKICQLIDVLSERKSMSRADFSSLQGRINHVKWVRPSQGEAIWRYAEKRLPAKIRRGGQIRKPFVRLSCPGGDGCRHARQRRARMPIDTQNLAYDSQLVESKDFG